MDYNIRDAILKNLVTVWKPVKKLEKIETLERKTICLILKLVNKKLNRNHFKTVKDKDENNNQASYIQQAAAAKAIGNLAKLSNQISEQFLSVTIYFKSEIFLLFILKIFEILSFK